MKRWRIKTTSIGVTRRIVLERHPQVGKHPTSNIRHPTSKFKPPLRGGFRIGCWVSDVGCWMFPKKLATALLVAACLSASAASSTNYPPPTEGDFGFHDFHFRSGESLPELRVHYLTFGAPVRDKRGVVRNAILILHGTGGSAYQFLRSDFAHELYGQGQPFDVSRYYLIIPDGIGHGKSSKPSDGLRAKFPKYGYQDMIAAQYQLVTDGLHVNHLRLVFGTSMGGMHTWLWGETYPDFMDALMPMASLPTQISGRNRAWRRIVIDAIRNDPEWHNG